MSVGSCREGRVKNVVGIKYEQLLRYCRNLFLPNVAASRETEHCANWSVCLWEWNISTVMGALS